MPYDIGEPNWDEMWEAECAFHEKYFGMGYKDAIERNPWPEWFDYQLRDKASGYYYAGRMYALEEMIGLICDHPKMYYKSDFGEIPF